MNFSPRNQMAARRAAQRKRPDRIISILLILSLLFGNLAGFPSAAAELTSYCGKEEHVHTEECYKVAVTTEPTETEGGEETTSETTEAMEETEAAQTVILSDTPVRGKEEHTHTLKCYSNPDADVEAAANWEATLPETLTGTWADDLLATVRSQVGYKESVENFIVEADGETTSGYNRYGAWYGSYTQDENQPYLPWNITFLFFSIYYSNIDDFPLEETCPDWIDSLDYYGLYRAAGEYTPAEGDLVFVDTDGDGEADRVGVASEVKDNKLIAIEGDYEGAVAEVTYDLPELTVEPETTETEGTTEIDVSVSMNALLLLSDGTEEGDEAPQPTVVGYADMAQAQADAQPESGEISTLAWNVGNYLYLDISKNTGWKGGSAVLKIYYKTDGSNWAFAAMEETSDPNIYQVALPSDMNLTSSAFKFVRMDPDKDLNATGSVWNWMPDGQNNDLTLQSNYNKYIINDGSYPGAVMCNLFLADEINRTTAKTQSALLEVMEEGSVTVDGVTRQVPEPFLVIATENPIGSAGTQMLPESQLDRFMICTAMGYPEAADEVRILEEQALDRPLTNVRQVISKQQLLQMQQEVGQVYTHPLVYQYIVELSRATRQNPYLSLGLSPRASLAAASMARATAYLNDRDFTLPDDVQAIFKDVAQHRLRLSSQAQMERKDVNQVLDEILASVRKPRPEITNEK